MDLENTDSGSDTSAEIPTASSENVASESIDSDAQPETSENGVDTPVGSLTTNEIEEPQIGNDADEEEAALQAAANDPTTPQWARDKIKQAMAYAGRLKESRTAAEIRATEIAAQYEGKESLDPTEIERLKASDDLRFKMQSITATPDDIIELLQAENPRVFPELQNQLVWNALENTDGTPNYENLQFVVDKFTGGGVEAKDILQAAQALKNGVINADDLHEFDSAEDYERYQQATAREREMIDQQKAIDKHAEFSESKTRGEEISRVMGSVQTQYETQVQTLMDKFKLSPVENEPKVATEFKADVLSKIQAIVQSAPTKIRELGEISKGFEILRTPGKKLVDPESAVNQIRAFTDSPAFKQNVAKGLSSLMTEVEQAVAREAYTYKLLMQGLEVENSKAKSARPVINTPNQSANLPRLTPDDLAKMSAAERQDHSAKTASEQFRQLNPSYGAASRTGQ